MTFEEFPLDVPRETRLRLEHYVALLLAANRGQNLIGANTIGEVWNRHIVDSAQILNHAPSGARFWLDVGSGAGLPGLVLAILTSADHCLVEPRRLRADFLEQAVQDLGLGSRVTVQRSTVEKAKVAGPDVITARAFRSLTATLAATAHLAGERTTWLLNKGRRAAIEVEEARQDWRGRFELLPSITDPTAAIVRVTDLRSANPS